MTYFGWSSVGYALVPVKSHNLPKNDTILHVPISRHGGEDFISWSYTRFGFYTIRSGCNLARTDLFFEQRSVPKIGSSSETERDKKLWKEMWAIKAPRNMKIIVWQFAHDCLLRVDTH